MNINGNPGFETESMFRTIIEQSPSPVGLYVGPDMVVTVVNNAILKVWDKDASVVGKTFRQALPELEGQPFFDLLDNVFKTGIPYEAHAERVDLFFGGQMQTFYFNFIYQPIINDAGEVWAILNTADDVTELVLTRQKLAETEERSRFALESAQLGAWDMDPVNEVVTWNERCNTLHGFAPGDVVPFKKVLKHVHPDDLSNIKNKVQAVLNPGSGGYFDEIFRIICPEKFKYTVAAQ